MKKAQVEIFGFLIIVILITVIAIFAVSFMLRTRREIPKNTDVIANNLLNALLKTTICEKSLSNVLTECYKGLDPCENCKEHISSEIESIMNKLDLKKQDYKFIVSISGDDFISLGNCNEKDVSLASPYIKYTNSKLLKANLYLCDY